MGKLAEQVNNLGHKGRVVRVVGRLKQERWQDRDGKAQSKVVIVAEHTEFRPDFKKEGNAGEEDPVENTEEAENLVLTF
jgi:single-strand DNA-binding protein